MTLQELIDNVKEHKLTRDQLENYRDEMSALYSKMCLERADLEKMEARFPSENYDSAIARKNAWKATPAGQRLIEIKNYMLATKEMLSSLKSRIYDRIYD